MTSWTLPEELKQLPPRETRPSGWFLFISIILTLMIAGLVWIMLHTFVAVQDLQTFKATGTQMEGIVSNLHTRLVNGKHPHTNYYVDYKYRLVVHYFDGNKDTTFQRTALVSSNDFQSLRVNQEVPIIYDRNMPAKSVLAFENTPYTINDSANSQGFSIYITNGIYACILVAVFLWIVCSYLKQRKLLMWGRPTQAFVIDAKIRNTRGGRVVNLTYKFKDIFGQSVQAVGNSIPAATILSHEDNLTVLYDPNDSSISAIYPLRLVTHC